MEVQGDCPQDPGEDDAVEAEPRGGLDRAHGIEEDVVIEGVAAKDGDSGSRTTETRSRMF
jgi:hypothetical protein